MFVAYLKSKSTETQTFKPKFIAGLLGLKSTAIYNATLSHGNLMDTDREYALTYKRILKCYKKTKTTCS